MHYIYEFREGERINGIYMVKQKTAALTRNGKPYDNLILQDKTGTIDGKIWDPNSNGIDDFDALDYIDLVGEVVTFAGALQLNVRRVRKCGEGEYDPADYFPVSKKNNDQMFSELASLMESVQNPCLYALLENLFIKDEEFQKTFRKHSAAKTVHHGFIGGLLEHTLGVARICNFMAATYPVLKRDLLITAAILHDVGKTREIAAFPKNDYTDEGQLLGHIVIGAQMVSELTDQIPDFPPVLKNELIHCILAHHGEYEYGSPKKPAIAEALALNLADNMDAKMESFTEIFEGDATLRSWLGFNRLFDSNIRRTEEI